MKIFIYVLIAAAIIGGFAGGELSDTTFSIVGMVVGGLGTGAILLGLGAYFHSQEQRKPSPEITPEMRKVFDSLVTGKSKPTENEVHAAKQKYLKEADTKETAEKSEQNFSQQNGRDAVLNTVMGLIAEDVAMAERGETPERRLVPHHAIKRDVIISAYTKDFDIAKEHIESLDWSEDAKASQKDEITKDFNEKINGIKRLGHEDLDGIISLMKKTRTDFREIEDEIRASNSFYKNIEPL